MGSPDLCVVLCFFYNQFEFFFLLYRWRRINQTVHSSVPERSAYLVRRSTLRGLLFCIYDYVALRAQPLSCHLSPPSPGGYSLRFPTGRLRPEVQTISFNILISLSQWYPSISLERKLHLLCTSKMSQQEKIIGGSLVAVESIFDRPLVLIRISLVGRVMSFQKVSMSQLIFVALLLPQGLNNEPFNFDG